MHLLPTSIASNYTHFRLVANRLHSSRISFLCASRFQGHLSRLSRRFAAQAAVAEPQEITTHNKGGFSGLGLNSELVAAVAELRLSTPTEIQSSAIPEVLAGGDVLLASHTGSGKTLAYLLPLIKLLKDAETSGQSARPKRPRALVLGPTRELTDQILAVAKSLSHNAKFRSACINGGGTPGQQASNLSKPLDILIGTPKKVFQHAEKGNLFFGDVDYVVLDEADTMFDHGFGPEVRAVLNPTRNKDNPATCIFVLATLQKDIQKLLSNEFKEMRYIKTSSLHKTVSKARHVFLPVPGLENKFDYLIQALGGGKARHQRTIVFCNTLSSCRATEHYLREQGRSTVCYHGDVPLVTRQEAIQQFCDVGNDQIPPIMVCTDIAARGLDLTGGVNHVINFDFPFNPIDYIHRSGRTARAGSSGKVTSLVAKKDRVLAGRIEEAIFHGRALDELSADKSVVPPNLRPKAETLQRHKDTKMAVRNSQKGLRGAARHNKSTKESIISKRTPPPAKSSRFSATGTSKSDGKRSTFGSSLAHRGVESRDGSGSARSSKVSPTDRSDCKRSTFGSNSASKSAKSKFDAEADARDTRAPRFTGPPVKSFVKSRDTNVEDRTARPKKKKRIMRMKGFKSL